MKIYSHNLKISNSIVNGLTEYITMLIIAVGIVGLIAGSHRIGVPLYKINPMHWVVYFVILFKKPSFSSIAILAFALPLTSNILTGHPLIIKSIIMSFELLIYGMIFSLLYNHVSKSIPFAYIVSQIVGHIIYFSLKYILIKIELMNSVMFTSSVIIQIIVFIILGLCLQIISTQRQKV